MTRQLISGRTQGEEMEGDPLELTIRVIVVLVIGIRQLRLEVQISKSSMPRHFWGGERMGVKKWSRKEVLEQTADV